ncbi:T1SS secreted agglutinin RTX [Pseudomonas synxantha]|uniref:Ig-like domain-containing protein n=1 Tax=Pseudomonas synxantha TaxID=47883 RepID=UPI000F570B82|nr:Ig-like domain-containing protein [Pseudomonas synxantha]AZE73546.1 T1SS secreted agglutinin RTX [Pseudomonas synxantha]
MNANVVNVAVVDGKTITQTVELSSVKNGQPVRIKAVQGGKYILAEGANGVAPENITIKRVGKDLHIALEGSDPDQPQLIIEDFEGSGGQLVGVAEDGSYHEYISSDAEQDRSAAFLIEGVEAPQVLGAQPLPGFGDGLAAAAGIGWFWPALLGLAALGVLGGVYAANRDDGGNDDAPGGGGSGNTDKGSIGGVDDNVGDKQGLIENGGSTDDRTPTFTGEGKPGTSVEIIDNGKTIGTAIVGEDGKWEYTPPVPGLDDGKHEIVIVPVDKDGNKGEPSPGYEIIVDTVAPSQPSIDGLFDDVVPQEGQIGIGGHTNDTTPTLSGTGEAGSIIHIYDNGVEIGTALADADGKWSFTPDPALTEGPHEFTVTAEDAAGNISTPSSPFPIIVDITLPGKPGVGTGGIEDVRDNVGLEQGSIVDGGLTDDDTPTLIGSGAESGDTIIIIDNGVEIGTAIVGEDGKWEFTPDPALTDGTHEIVVVIKDPAGNESEPSDPHTIIVDTTAPGKPGVGTGGIEDVRDNVGLEQGSIVDGGLTDDDTPTLIGSGAESGDTIIIIDNGVEIGTAIVGEDGKWEFTPDPALTDGTHEIVVVIKDPAGNESEPSDPHTIIVDTTAPGKPGVGTGGIEDVRDNVGLEQGSIVDGGVTDDDTPTLIGSGAEPGDTVTIIDNGVEIGTAMVGADGKWEFTPDPVLADGTHEIVVVITDPAGNESEPSDPHTIIVDTTAPGKPGVGTGGIEDVRDNVGLEQGSIVDGGVTDDDTPTLIGSGAEPGDTVTIIDNGVEIGTAMVGADGKWEFTPDPVLTDGTHEIVVVIKDPAGNESEPSDPHTIIVDTAAPAAPTLDSVYDDQGNSIGDLVSGQVTDDSRPDLSGTAEPGSLVTIYDNGVAIGSVVATGGTWTFTPALPLTNGSHTLAVTATDPAGNESAPTADFDLNVLAGGAPTAPAIITVEDDQGTSRGPIAPNQSTDDARPTISGTGGSGDTITVYANGQALGTTFVDGNGQWTFTPPTPLADGLHNLSAQATDAVGNLSPATGDYPINVDTVAPGAPVSQVLTDDVGTVVTINPNDVTDDANPTFSGTAEAGSIVKIYDNGTLIGSAAADATTGAWSFTPATALIDGAHSFSAEAVDGAGNVGPMGPAIPFTVDTSAVVISITSVEDNAGTNMGLLTSGQTTDDTTPTLSGSATPGGTVSIYDGTTLLGTVMADATTGQWTFTTPVLSTGSHDLTATVTTAAGGESAPTAVFETIIDTTAPGVPVIDDVDDNVGASQGTITDGGSTDDTTPTLSGDGLQAGDTVKIYDGSVLLGTTTVGTDGSWVYVPTTPLNDGSHEFTVVAVDPAGNASAPSTSWTVVIDTAAPIASAVVDSMSKDSGSDSSDFVTNDGSAGRLIQGSLTAALAAGEKVQITTDGGATWLDVVMDPNGTWSAIDHSSHSNDWTIQTRVIDQAGNESLNSQAVDFDSRTPDAPDSISRAGNVVTIQLGSGDIVANDMVSIIVDGQRFEVALTDADIANGTIDVSLPVGTPVGGVLAAAIVSPYGSASAYVGNNEVTEDFDGFPAGGALSRLDTTHFSVVQEAGVFGIGPSQIGLNGNALIIGQAGNLNNNDIVRFDLEESSTSVIINLRADNGGANYFQYYDADGNSLGSVNVNSTTSGRYVFNAPANTEIASFRYYSAGEEHGIELLTITLDSSLSLGDQEVIEPGSYYGGATSDVFLVSDVDSLDVSASKVIGNGGLDTLKLTGSDQVLDLGTIAGELESVEIIDITGTGNNTLNLSLSDVLEQGETSLFTEDEATQMMIKGNAGDVVNLDDLLPDDTDPGDWATAGTATVAGVTYNVFQHSTLDAQLLIQDGVATNLV